MQIRFFNRLSGWCSLIPALMLLSACQSTANITTPVSAQSQTLILVGDSTMAPNSGYGNALCAQFSLPVSCLNLAKGGRAIDMTTQVSKEFVDIAFKALKAIEGLNVAGVDILCQDPTVSSPNYVILEVNSNPGLAMHAFPDEGAAQPVGDYLLEILI